MIRTKLNTLKKLCAASLFAAGLSIPCLSTAQDANLTVGNNDTYSSGTHNGYYYSVWKDNYDLTVVLREGGRYTANWQNGNNWVGGKGWNPGGPRRVKYTGTYNHSGISYLALYGWADSPTQDYLIEYYVVEAHNPAYSPQNCNSVSGHQNFSYTVDGVRYEFGVCMRINQPSIRSDSDTFMQFFAVRQGASGRSGNVEGFIDTNKHFDQWASRGYDLTNHNYMILASEGYQGSGSSDITLGETDCGVTNSGMPICCSIDVDPDGDGVGSQFAGEMCEVTESTVGWHPPNPDSVIAAINAGGPVEPVEHDGIWYRGNFLLPGSTANASDEGNLAAIYQSEFWGDDMTAEIALPDGVENVKVTLGFVELYHDGAGNRSFDVTVEDQPLLSNMDLFAETGGKNRLLEKVVETTVTDGSLTIELVGNTDNATISAILVERADVPVSSSSSVSSSSASSEPASSSSVSSSGTTSSAGASSSESSTTTGGSLNWWMFLMLTSLLALGRRGMKR